MAKRPRKTATDPVKIAKRVARNVIGVVKSSRAIEPDGRKKKPKYKKDPLQNGEE